MFSSTLDQDDILRQLDEAFPSELIHKLEHEVKAIASAPTSSSLHDPIIHDVLKIQRRNLPLLVEKARTKKKDRVSIKELSLRLNKYLLYIVDPSLLDESKMHYEQALKELMSETPHTKKGSKKYPKDYISQILMDNYELFLKVSTSYFNLSFSSIVTRYLVSIIYKLECWEIYHLLHVIPELEYMLNLLEFEVKHTSFGYIVKPPANFLDFNLRQGLQYPFPYPFYNFSYHSLDPRAGSRKMKRISVKPYIDLRLDRDKRGVSKDTPATKDEPVRDCALDVQEYTDTDYSSDDSDDFRRWKIVYMFIEMSPDEIYQDFDLCFSTSVKREYEDEEYDSDHARLIDERERVDAGVSVGASADLSVSSISQADPSITLPKGSNAPVAMTRIPSSFKSTDTDTYISINANANANTNMITNNTAFLDASRQPEIIVLDPPQQPEIIVLDPPEQPEIVVLDPPHQPEITHTPAILDPPQELKIVPSIFQKAFAQAFDDGLVRNTLLHQCKLVDPVSHKTCMKVFYGKNELTRHQEFVHATCKKLYRCAYCQDDPNEEKIKAYPRYDSLARHIRRKHGIVGQDNKIAINLARELAEAEDTVVASDPLTDLGSGGRPEAWVTLESNTGISRSAISSPSKKRRKSSSRPPWANPVDEERKADEYLRFLSPDLDPVKSTSRSVSAKSVPAVSVPVGSASVESDHVKSVKSTPTLIPSGVLPTSAFPSVVAPSTSATSAATSPKSNAFKHNIVSGNLTQNLFWANGRSGVFSTPQNRAAQVQGSEISEPKIKVQGSQGPSYQQTSQVPGQVKMPRAQGIYRQTQPFHPYKPHGQLPQAYSLATNEDSKTKHTRVSEHPVASGSHQNIGEGLRGQFGIPRNDLQYYPYTKPAYPYSYPPQVPEPQTQIQIQGSMSEQSQNSLQNSLHTSHEVFQSDMNKNPTKSAQSNYISSPSGQSEAPSERQD